MDASGKEGDQHKHVLIECAFSVCPGGGVMVTPTVPTPQVVQRGLQSALRWITGIPSTVFSNKHVLENMTKTSLPISLPVN